MAAMLCPSKLLVLALTAAAAADTSEVGLPQTRVLRGAIGDAQALADRALAGEEEHHHGNLCEGKPNGWRCKDDHAVQCEGGRTVTHSKCAFYEECKEGMDGPGTASCQEDACEDKADGFHCKDDHVVKCAGLKTVNYTQCPFYQECKRDMTQLNMASCQEDVCDDEADGSYCKDDHVVQCQSASTVKVTACTHLQDCKKHAMGMHAAACQEECFGKADGFFCEDDHVVQCAGGMAVESSKCPFYQECKEGRAGPLTASCEEDACHDKADGWRCEGDHLVQCASLKTVDVKMCPSYQECQYYGGEASCM